MLDEIEESGELSLSKNKEKYVFDSQTNRYTLIEGADPTLPDYVGELKMRGDGEEPVKLRVVGWMKKRKADGQSFLSCKIETDERLEWQADNGIGFADFPF